MYKIVDESGNSYSQYAYTLEAEFENDPNEESAMEIVRRIISEGDIECD